ncbi:bicaudal-D-related protein 2-like [Mastacembelus armatus]|uniref:Bicaudal-D-related protein 2-like n=1 Tax=Mastacembelus armatus TaxID=205130 RepID=A0A7N8WNI1_9TELE|nr:BICD family-like cargo adapter 1 [Mastacembelus armatus]
MDYSQPFSVLNESLRPRITSSEHLYSSLSRLEDRQLGSLRGKSPSHQPTCLLVEPEPEDSVASAKQEGPEQPEDDTQQEDLVSDDLDEFSDDLLPVTTTCLLTELNLKCVPEEELVDEDRSSSQSGEKDSLGELATERTGDSSESGSSAGEGGSSLQRNYIDGTLPDLIKSGRPLSRRRTLGHVSATLNEVRREVELSRRRSIRLKAQVDKLQEGRDGPGWSQHRERVTEEVLSILGLLHPLTELESNPTEPSRGDNCLDAALAQLKNVARKLAISHTKQVCKLEEGKGEEESAILQQALRDRDEAIEKKKAMEAELLRSKTELMLLNNQLLEAVQKRLELSLELEAWREDFQVIIRQQIQSQQQAEQAQKKSRLGILRRNNKPLIQRPSSFPLSVTNPPTVNSNQIFVPRAAASAVLPPSLSPSSSSQRNLRDRLRRGKSSRQENHDAEWVRDDDGFQAVPLE